MYHKNKSLCFLVAEVAEVAERGRKRAFLTPSEGQVGRDGYASAVDFGSLELHQHIPPFVAAAHTLEPLLVEYLAEGAQ